MKPSRRSVDSSKKEAQRTKVFAKGGATRMLGRGDKTITAGTDAAGKQQPGSTAHKTTSSGGQFAKGGKLRPIGGLARPAKPA